MTKMLLLAGILVLGISVAAMAEEKKDERKVKKLNLQKAKTPPTTYGSRRGSGHLGRDETHLIAQRRSL